MIDEELKSHEDKLLELKVSIRKLIRQRKKLLEDDNVKKYIGIEKELDSSTKEAMALQGIILEEQQQRCPHPAWYFEDSFTDIYEGRTYWTCKCVVCGKRLEEARSRDYPNDRVIWDECIMGDPTESKLSYKEVADKWVKFMEDFPQEDKTIEEKGRTFTKMMNPSKIN